MQVETAATNLGEVVSASRMTSLTLGGGLFGENLPYTNSSGQAVEESRVGQALSSRTFTNF
jgi:hypothetical protein